MYKMIAIGAAAEIVDCWTTHNGETINARKTEREEQMLVWRSVANDERPA